MEQLKMLLYGQLHPLIFLNLLNGSLLGFISLCSYLHPWLMMQALLWCISTVSLWSSSFPCFQIMILLVLPNILGSSGANYAKNLLRAAILLQYIPRLYKFLPLFAGQSSTGFIFESAWANFFINLFTFTLSGHIVGSGWYLFGLQVSNLWL